METKKKIMVMIFEIFVVLNLILSATCLKNVIEGYFSFVGWQNFSMVSSLPIALSEGEERFRSVLILCTFTCVRNNDCQMFYMCRLNGQAVCLLSSLYDQNTNGNSSLQCKSYKFRGDCDVDGVLNRYNGVCVKVSPTCEYKDCDDIRVIHGSITGRYPLSIDGSTVPARCDMDSDGGGWIVIQRRLDGSVDFFRNWNDYKIGFGDSNGEYWLGLDSLHELTSNGGCTLRIDMKLNSMSYYVKYSGFVVGSESDNYRMNYASFVAGNTEPPNQITLNLAKTSLGNSLSWHNGRPFTTFDHDNDDNINSYGNPNCAIAFYGAWWYAGCHNSNLNGHYGNTSFGRGINWSFITGYYQSLTMVEMKIKRT